MYESNCCVHRTADGHLSACSGRDCKEQDPAGAGGGEAGSSAGGLHHQGAQGDDQATGVQACAGSTRL